MYGPPLSIVLVAGLLSKIDKTEKMLTRWNEALLVRGRMAQRFREISVSKLTNLWIAEAFIKSNEEKSLEGMAEDYLEDLIGRNLIMVTKRRSTGKIKACRVHDLMLEFCKEKVKKIILVDEKSKEVEDRYGCQTLLEAESFKIKLSKESQEIDIMQISFVTCGNATIAELVNLEVLKLQQVPFEMTNGKWRNEEFSQLKFLE
ncbi:hypothetical protein HAX54_005527 [Datura stramonium]|uniref:Disease resistance protein winged helix domain-containing protein n=1 Tax=Datura stramonium TaxID=4076 RepID=A0ABS8TBA9_DATST|nr:hypothetical protein [Datura stramonium]